MKKVSKIVISVLSVFMLVFSFSGLDSTSKVNAASKVSFKDVTKSYWAYDDIYWAVNKGLIVGYTDGRFKPNALLTESQFVAVMTRYFSPTLTNGIPAKNQKAVQYKYLADNGIMLPGHTDVNKKDKPITRITMARALHDSQGYKGTDRQIVSWMFANGLTSGKGTSSDQYTNFGANDNLERVQVSVFFKRSNKIGISELLVNKAPEVPGTPGTPGTPGNPGTPEVPGKPSYDNSKVKPLTGFSLISKLEGIASKFDAQIMASSTANGPSTIFFNEDSTDSVDINANGDRKYLRFGIMNEKNKDVYKVVEEVMNAAGYKGEPGQLSNALYNSVNGKGQDINYNNMNIMVVKLDHYSDVMVYFN